MTTIDFFDNIRFWGTTRNKYLEKFGYYRGRNFLGQLLGNFFLPPFFRITKNFECCKLNCEKNKIRKESSKVIVSMTSFPARINRVWLAVESIFRQKVKPDKILLCLTKSQIPDVSALPRELQEMQRKGLEIIFCNEKIRSHTKYWSAFSQYPNDIIITVDDDIIYRSDLIENLINFHKRFPKAIIVNWAKKISLNDEGKSVYNCWPEAQEQDIGVVKPNYSLFGVAGVLYPPHSMYEDCLNPDLIKELSLTADDIWLSAQAILKGTHFVFTGYRQNHLPVSIRNNETLLSVNSTRNQVQVDNINNYYEQKIGIRPFDKFQTGN